MSLRKRHRQPPDEDPDALFGPDIYPLISPAEFSEEKIEASALQPFSPLDFSIPDPSQRSPPFQFVEPPMPMTMAPAVFTPALPPARNVPRMRIKKFDTEASIVDYDVRMDLLQVIRDSLKGVPEKTCIQDVARFSLDPDQRTLVHVGKGTYGNVFEWQNTDVVVKQLVWTQESKKTPEEWLQYVDCEEWVLQSCRSMVELKVCPNFQTIIQRLNCPLKVDFLMEYTQGSLYDLVLSGEVVLSTDAFMSIIFQVFVAILCLHLFLGIVHNDLKHSNVLVNVVPRDMHYVYNIFGNVFNVDLNGFQAKVIDFGLATQSPATRCLHSHPDVLIKDKRVNLERIENTPPPNVHVLQVDVRGTPIPPFARDYWFFLQQFDNQWVQAKQPHLPVTWIRAALYTLSTLSMKSPLDSVRYFGKVFTDEFALGTGTQTSFVTHIPPPPQVRAETYNVDLNYQISTADMIAKQTKCFLDSK